MWIVIDYIVVGVDGGFSPERVVSYLSPETSSRCQYVILTNFYLSQRLIYLSLWARVVTVGKEKTVTRFWPKLLCLAGDSLLIF